VQSSPAPRSLRARAGSLAGEGRQPVLSGHSLWFGECLTLPFGRARCRDLGEALHRDWTAGYLPGASRVTTQLGGSPKPD